MGIKGFPDSIDIWHGTVSYIYGFPILPKRRQRARSCRSLQGGWIVRERARSLQVCTNTRIICKRSLWHTQQQHRTMYLGPTPFPKGGWAEILAVSKPPIQTSFIFIVDMKLLQFGTHRVVGINMLSPDSSSQAGPTFSWSGLHDYMDLSVKVCLREYHASFPFSPLTQILR